MNNVGLIHNAVKELIELRNKFDESHYFESDYGWVVKIIITDDIRFTITVNERIFKRFVELDAPYETQVETLSVFIFQMVEENLSMELDVPKSLN
jgi:hypothetical protein